MSVKAEPPNNASTAETRRLIRKVGCRLPLFLGILWLTAALTGCQQPTQAEIKFLETRELDLPLNEAYMAAANGIFSLGYSIEHSDKDSGILTGRRKYLGVAFVLGQLGIDELDEDIAVMLTQVKPEITQLRMKVLRNGKPLVDRKLMTQIWQSIEREAMLETRPASATLPSDKAGPATAEDASEHPPETDAEQAQAHADTG